MDFLVIGIIWAAMVASGIWESSVEGDNAWEKNKRGWKIGRKPWILTRYHFFLFWVTFPLVLSIPLVLNYSPELLRTIAFGYVTGVLIQDLSWFVSNPGWGLKRWNPENVDWFAWVRIGRFAVPVVYIAGLAIAAIIAFI
ncbi:MAG: hypothetical protein ACMXYM_00125 [Candidatus Woesearchaeota archaeon]